MLPTGKRLTVERSAMIDAMVRNGFVRIVAEQTDARPPETASESAESDAGGEGGQSATRPGKSTSKAAWRDYLTAHGVPFDWTATRDELIELADMHVE